ncbi:hypothetical protein FY034_04810 [Trichlorobacter lovleyi]|uniref:hypothetical protein n=1 Tax=Trichlorobacter lovleyi TaxID=313985 RepID=UPI00223FD291|nr:hypothetical protein [Trichlorobacter lovleyi]QOX78281.1 hypothetical protein FY034_04810 [Trichlorobacter lovleyi]
MAMQNDQTTQTTKQGLGGASYDPSQVFDPSKKPQAIAEPPKAGLDVSPNAGTSAIAGAGYYAGRPVPSNNPMAIAGMEASKPQGIAGPAQPIAGATSQPTGSTSQSSGPLGMPDKAPAIAGFSIAGAGASAPGGASLIGTPKTIAGMTPDSLQTVGKMQETGMSASGVRRMDAINQQAIAGIGKPGNGLMDNRGRTYDEQVAHAAKVNEAGQRDLMRMSPREQAAAETVNNRNFGSFIRGGAAGDLAGYESRRNAIAGQLADTQAQRIAGIKEQSNKYATDQHLAGVKYNADAHVKAAGIAGDANIAKAQQTALGKQQEQVQQQYSDRVKGLMSGWSKLNVPTHVAPKLNYYAQLHAQAEDPRGNVFMLSPNRQGGQYAALPRVYESHYQKLMKGGMSHNDAAARIYGVAQKNGHAIDVPDFARFQTRKEATEG